MCFRQGSLILCCYLVSRPKRFRLLGKQQVACKRPCSICNLAVCIFCLSKKTGGGLQKIFMCSSSVKISASWLSVSCKRQGQSLSRAVICSLQWSCKGNRAHSMMARLTEQEHPRQRHSPTVTEQGKQRSGDGNKGQPEVAFSRQVCGDKEVWRSSQDVKSTRQGQDHQNARPGTRIPVFFAQERTKKKHLRFSAAPKPNQTLMRFLTDFSTN